MMSDSSREILTIEEESPLQAANRAAQHKEAKAIFFMV
jgi:hypothetical protein